jgi:hypothetical protein
MGGKTALVVESTHTDAPDRAVLSFDGMPGHLGLVPHVLLLPADERPCLSLDPACCSLRPCEQCMKMLRAHLGDAMRGAGLTATQGEHFISVWNRQRSLARDQLLNMFRQSREYLEKTKAEAAAAVEEPRPTVAATPTAKKKEAAK